MSVSLVSRPLLSIAVAGALFVARPCAAASKAEQCAESAEHAQSLRQAQRFVDAQRAFLTCVSESCPAFIRSDCTKWFEEVSASIATIVVRVQTADDREVLDATVTVDGQVIESTGKAIAVDPGEHVIRATRGAEQVEERIVAAEAEKHRFVTLRIGAPVTPAVVRPVERVPERASGGRGPWPWVTGGAAVIGLSLFGILQLSAQSRYDELERTCGTRCDAGDVNGIRRQVIGSAVALGVGVVAGVATVLLLLPRSAPRVRAAAIRAGEGSGVIFRF